MISSLAAYLAVFLALAGPWIVAATRAVPGVGNLAPLVSPDDARMICWAFGWIPHAALTAPARLLDAPINYPAPAQLIGSEHFASSVLLAAPIFWSTGNAVLAANAIALASYPLAALAMDRLLLALGGMAGLALASRPYFARPEAQTSGFSNVWWQGRVVSLFAEHVVPMWFGNVALLFGGLGAAALVLGGPAARRTAGAGLLMAVAGGVLMLPPRSLGELIIASPARFFRAPWRFVVVTGFGTALLGAAALEAARQRLPRRRGDLVVALAALALVADRGRVLVGAGLDEIPAAGRDAPVYDAVAQSTAGERSGALLELPLRDARAAEHRTPMYQGVLEADAMVGATRHWLPLLVGHTGYVPPHRRLVEAAIDRLPDAGALSDLVDMTHLRWLLLRPEDYWQDAASRAELLRLPDVRVVLARAGWVLARVDRVPRHPEWFAAIAGGARAGRSLLGTPLGPLGPLDGVGRIAVADPPRTAPAGGRVALAVELANLGAAGWPAAMAGADTRYTVELVARWRRGADAGAVARIPLARDVPAGEQLAQRVALSAPAAPGPYRLELAVEQVGGTRLSGPAAVLDLAVDIVPPG